jgi:hypothetical protein
VNVSTRDERTRLISVQRRKARQLQRDRRPALNARAHQSNEATVAGLSLAANFTRGGLSELAIGARAMPSDGADHISPEVTMDKSKQSSTHEPTPPDSLPRRPNGELRGR